QIPQKVDERCFFYCSQTSRGRSEGQLPMCRSICLRKVFPHELMTPTPNNGNDKAKIEGHAGLPLPPEGQPPKRGYFSGVLEEPKETRYWREGWYLWTSRSPWSACDKIDSMQKNLPTQALRRQTREKEEERIYNEWAKRPPGPKPSVDEVSQHLRTELDGSFSSQIGVNFPPIFHWYVSSLIALPPPLLARIEKLLNPTFKVMETVRESFESGAQQELAMRMWEKARSPDPFILARNVCRKVWEKWNEGPPDGDAKSDE
ncbi:hypothetical protein F5I97DRAFT_1815096, partial [Phlebopus sp. FC_14]